MEALVGLDKEFVIIREGLHVFNVVQLKDFMEVCDKVEGG